MVKVFRWLAFRLGLLMSILVLVLFLPLASLVGLIPVRLRQRIGRRAVALWEARAQFGSRIGAGRDTAVS